MIEFLEQAKDFLILTGSLLIMLIVFAFYKAGWDKKVFMENWVKAEGDKKPIWKGILFILGIPLLLGAVLYATNVESREVDYSFKDKYVREYTQLEWFSEATVYVGLDYTQNPSPLCRDYGATDKITSNMGFTQSIARKDAWNVVAKYTHHSCAISADKNSYDALGVMVEWTIK